MCNRFLSFEDVQQTLPDLTRFLARVDALPDAGVLVVADNGDRLDVVGGQSLLESIGVIVGSLHERFARHVVLHGLLGRVEGLVVGTARGWVDQSARDTRD